MQVHSRTGCRASARAAQLRTSVGHDGQEVVAGHLALSILDLVGALQRLRSGSRQVEKGGGL